MKPHKKITEQPWFHYSVATCSAVVLFLLLSNFNKLFSSFFGTLRTVLSPLIIGLITAYLVDPVVKSMEKHVFRKIEKRKLRRSLSMVLAVIIVLLVFVLLMVSLIPQLFNSGKTLVDNMDGYIKTAEAFLNTISHQLDAFSIDTSFLDNMQDRIFSMISTWIQDNASNIFNTSYNIGLTAMNFVIGMILALYFLGDKDHLVSGMKHFLSLTLSPTRYHRLLDFSRRCHVILIQYISYSLLEALLVGVLNAILMACFKMNYIILISVTVAVTNLIPTFGPIIGGAIGAFILVLINPLHALYFLIITVVLQTIDGYVIKPRLFGGSLGVSGVWILLFVIVGGKLFGIAGMLLAIPCAAIASFIYNDWKISRANLISARADKAKDEDSEDDADDNDDNDDDQNNDGSGTPEASPETVETEPEVNGETFPEVTASAELSETEK